MAGLLIGHAHCMDWIDWHRNRYKCDYLRKETGYPLQHFSRLYSRHKPQRCKQFIHADWGPLQSRTITIWPDNDAEGQNYAQSVARAVKRPDANLFRLYRYRRASLPKWDLADTLPEGWTEEQIINLLVMPFLLLTHWKTWLSVANKIGETYKPDALSALYSLKRRFISLYEPEGTA